MLEKIQRTLKNQLTILKPQINHCKICFKPIKNPSIFGIFHNDLLCSSCKNKLIPKFIKFDINGIDGLSIYEYDDNIKSLLYQLKGCGDIELAKVFLYPFSFELSKLYKNYIMIPVPSFEKDDVNRGFNHVEEIFKDINLKTCKIIHKIKHVKQAKNNLKERKIARHVFTISEDEKITGKKVLIVDDVSTTGETLKAIVDLVKGARPKQIKILVMSKRIL